MAEIDVTRMSSKGQIVIPKEMRESFSEGEKFVIIRSGHQLMLKRVRDFDKSLKEDLVFAKKTEEALRRYERGLFRKMSGKEFLRDLDKW